MGGKIYLNITYGLSNKLPGFININSEPSADVQWDVTQGLPFKDSSIDGIYSERFVEHLSQQQIFAFLRECRRVLRPGGVLRLAEIIRQYVSRPATLSTLETKRSGRSVCHHRSFSIGVMWPKAR
ncbi:hypothetical protein Hthe01_20620 [Hydrogenophilus thermoluteolus]|nr:hypothetical protein Hthe01_20620 [Hydrogenophilus thermoluteolus]